MAEVRLSGENCAAAPGGDSTQGLSSACHQIIDAASALLVNVEFLAQGAAGPKQRAAEDARSSVERIVKLARTLYGGQERKVPQLDLTHRLAGRRG